MKTRSGFVSNSSSSSFVIYGVSVQKSKLIEICGNDNPVLKKESMLWYGAIIKEINKLFGTKLEMQSWARYCNGDEDREEDIIVGKDGGKALGDGIVTDITPDYFLKKSICDDLNKLPISVKEFTPDMIRTYVQYVSNDNC